MTNCNRSCYNYIMTTLLLGCFLLMGVLGFMLLIHVMDNVALQKSLCTNLKLRLLLYIVSPTIVCLLLTLRKRRSIENAFITALIPYCIFLPQFLHMIVPIYELVFIVTIATSGICAALRIKKNVQCNYTFHDLLRLFLACLAGQQLICYIVSFLLAAIHQSVTFCISICSLLLIGSSAWIVGTYIHTMHLKHRDKGSLLFQRQKQSNAIRQIGDELKTKPWCQRNAVEKRHIIYRIVEIESGYLGIKTVPNIEYTIFAEDKKTLLSIRKNIAAYCAETNLIQIDHSLLMKQNPSSILKSLFHELRHAYQARLTDLLPFIPQEYSELLSMRHMEQIAYEFDHYEADINTDAYQFQLCEQDAEEYAHEALHEYMLLLGL